MYTIKNTIVLFCFVFCTQRIHDSGIVYGNECARGRGRSGNTIVYVWKKKKKKIIDRQSRFGAVTRRRKNDSKNKTNMFD